MNGVVPSPAVAEKALRLLEQQRVRRAADVGTMIVAGDYGSRLVQGFLQGVVCDCPAGANYDPVSCSHKVAAQIMWAES